MFAKGLTDVEQENDPIEYPCRIINRFQCPYEWTRITKGDDEAMNSNFKVDNLFELQKMAFIVEIALAKARKSDSEVQIRDKQDLLNALTDRDRFMKILQQASDLLNSTEYRDITDGQDNNDIVDYLMSLQDRVALDELTFY